MRTKKVKAKIKQDKIMGVQYFHGLWYYECINHSGVNFVSLYPVSYLHLIPHNLHQLALFVATDASSTDRVCRPLVTD